MTRVHHQENKSPAGAKNAPNGFTLLETLVALTILSLSVAVLFGIFSQTLDRTREDDRAMQARVLAQSLLSMAQSAPPGSNRQGEDATGLKWMLQVTPDADGSGAPGLHAETVTATVRWDSGKIKKSLALATRVIAPPREPAS